MHRHRNRFPRLHHRWWNLPRPDLRKARVVEAPAVGSMEVEVTVVAVSQRNLRRGSRKATLS